MATTESRPIDEGDVTLADCARTVWGYRRLIVGLCLCAVLVTFVLSITSRKIYESTATLLAPKEGTGTGLLAGLAGSGLLQQGPGFSVPSLTPNRDMQVSILKSRTVAQAVVERFRLQERYGSRYLEDAIHTLQRSTTISVSRPLTPTRVLRPRWRTSTRRSLTACSPSSEPVRGGASEYS